MLTELAYAKINLVLNINKKRDDGFHEVDFIMSCVDLYDTITIVENHVDTVECSALNINVESNIAYKALKLFKETYNIGENFKIIIDKKIPVAAGMAGGSADAAAVLRLLNRKFNLSISDTKLAELGSKLGSDVPFCVHSKLAQATGRGELIDLINHRLPDAYVVVINPGIELPTPLVYKNHIVKSESREKHNVYEIKEFNELISILHNDLQPTAIELEPSIEIIFDYISEKFDNKLMVSGSGPTVLAFCDNKKQAQEIYKYALEKYERTFITRLRN